MRTLILCVLAATLAGCSSQPLTQRSCTGLNALACLTAVDVPIEPPSYDDGSAVTTTSAVTQREEVPPRPQADRGPRRLPKSKVAAKAAPAVPLPMPSPLTGQQTAGMAPTSDASRTGAADPSSTTKTAPAKATEQQVASAIAEDTPTPDASHDTLAAILVTRPDVKSVNELAGKTIAIDDRYSEPSIGRVRIALAAAGATQIQLSKGQSTAISRLAGKEVPAAVIGLVSADAAESFPDLASLKTFRVPLSPRLAKK